MDHQDITGIGAAAAALALALAGWALSPAPAAVEDAAGLEQASRLALETNAIDQPLHWLDEGGTVATIIPASAYRAWDGSWCRPYAVVLAADGKRIGGSRHVACRDGEGRWSKRDVHTAAAEPVTQVAGALLR